MNQDGDGLIGKKRPYKFFFLNIVKLKKKKPYKAFSY